MMSQLHSQLSHHISLIYADILSPERQQSLADELISSMRITPAQADDPPTPHRNLWDQQDVMLITYADSIYCASDKPHASPLATLHAFLNKHLEGVINKVHLLPFFPYSSDDGFAVIDYSTVNPALGEWADIRQLARDYGLMFDLVINHCSSRSIWFEHFINKSGKGKDFFYTISEKDDLSQVVRPRTSDLKKPVKTAHGLEYVWCTFSHDQLDFDFRNPEVLLAFCDIIRLYLDQGATLFRLDAVAFLWKKLGTSCINLPETHEMVRLLRTLISHAAPNAIIITETNIPNRENLRYFGNANEAHAIYNFSLPPLLLHTLLSGDCSHLKSWMMSMPPAQNGTAYFNFIASHDGIGLRPAEGLLTQAEIDALVQSVQNFGGKVSWRVAEQGKQSPYELNISLIDALSGTHKGKDEYQVSRFLCAHTIMLGLEGIPGIYIHSLLATPNDEARVTHSGQNRAINRHRWEYSDLLNALETPSTHAEVLAAMKNRIAIRKQQAAFHPNATQFTLHLGKHLFGFWRQSIDRKQSIFCVANITDQPQILNMTDLNLISTENWHDLLGSPIEILDNASITLPPYQVVWLSN